MDEMAILGFYISFGCMIVATAALCTIAGRLAWVVYELKMIRRQIERAQSSGVPYPLPPPTPPPPIPVGPLVQNWKKQRLYLQRSYRLGVGPLVQSCMKNVR